MRFLLVPLTVLLASPAAAQNGYPASIAGAPPAKYADPVAAAASLEAMVAADSTDYGALWRAAMAVIDAGQRTPDDAKSAERDSLYARAERLARLAASIEPDRAEGHFALAVALGRTSLTKGTRDRVRYAKEIREAAQHTLRLDPGHDGAWHVLGRWNAGIMRLSGVERFFAKNFLGGAVFDAASWDNAVRAMEQAVAIRPEWIYHRLDLAEILVDRKRWEAAREQLRTVAGLRPIDPMDPEYQGQAAALLERIANRR